MKSLIEQKLANHKLLLTDVICAVRDGAKNMMSLFKIANVDSFQCLAHFLHLVVTQSIFEDNTIKNLIQILRENVVNLR